MTNNTERNKVLDPSINIPAVLVGSLAAYKLTSLAIGDHLPRVVELLTETGATAVGSMIGLAFGYTSADLLMDVHSHQKANPEQ